MNAPAKNLPMDWVEMIFTKLTLTYGRDFLSRWEGVDLAEVKADWARELGGFLLHPDAISYALGHLPNKPPTALEFRDIARLSPAKALPRLEAPRADERVVAEQLAKQLKLKEALAPHADGKQWARALIARYHLGERISPNSLKTACQALRIHPSELEKK